MDMAASGKRPKMDRLGQPKDGESFQILERAHGRYGASEAREVAKGAAARRTTRSPARRKGASTKSVKPVGT
jgi:hypothetical protein